MKKILLLLAALILGVGASYAVDKPDWSTINFLGSTDPAYNNQFKVQKVDGINEIVNIQKPGFADEIGIYVTFPAGIMECSVGATPQGAGIVLHLSSFTKKETEVTVKHGLGEVSFWVYNDRGESGKSINIIPQGSLDNYKIYSFSGNEFGEYPGTLISEFPQNEDGSYHVVGDLSGFLLSINGDATKSADLNDVTDGATYTWNRWSNGAITDINDLDMYIVGEMNSWTAGDDWKMTNNGDGTYKFTLASLESGKTFKINNGAFDQGYNIGANYGDWEISSFPTEGDYFNDGNSHNYKAGSAWSNVVVSLNLVNGKVKFDAKPSFELTEWTATDENIAKGRPAYVVAVNGNVTNVANITDDNNNTNCQVVLNNAETRLEDEWMVVDLGINYDVTKIQLVTTSNRKDKRYAIYTAPSQAVEPEFAVGTMALPAEAWTLVLEAEDDYENTGLGSATYAVDLSDVRYIKYQAVERNHNDAWGTAFAELRVAGTSDDPALASVSRLELSGVNNMVLNRVESLTVKGFNAIDNEIEHDAALLSASSSNEGVATVAVVEGKLNVTPVSAGTSTLTATYNGTVNATFDVTVYPATFTTWDGTDENIAKNYPVYVSAIHSGETAWINDDAIGNACQLSVNNGQPVEWMVLDLGTNYDVNKIQLVTTGDRKDRQFAIYTAPDQATEPEFANGVMALGDEAWTLAFITADNYADNGVVYKAYSVDLNDVRYVKYVGVERNHTDQYGVGFVEIRVAGTSDDPTLTIPAQIVIGETASYYVGTPGSFGYEIQNVYGGPVEYDATNVSVSSSNEAVATVALDGAKVNVTGLSAGTTIVTLTYEELTASVELTILPPFPTAPVPTQAAEMVKALYSDAYSTAGTGYGWYDWGGGFGHTFTTNGENMWYVPEWHYQGSQFQMTDATEYDYLHVDLYPTAATTVAIIPICSREEGGNYPERGYTTEELTPLKWHSIDISMEQFVENGVEGLDRLYQIKYIKRIEGAAEYNADGSYGLYFDNIYLYKVLPTFSIAMTGVTYDAATSEVTLNYKISHERGHKIDYYNMSAVKVEREPAGAVNVIRRAPADETVLHTKQHNHNEDGLTGTMTFAVEPNVSYVVELRAQAVLLDGTTINPAGWSEDNPDGHTGNAFAISAEGTVTGVEGVAADHNAPVYYNLQGVRVANPKSGLYIKVEGNNVSKVLVK